MPIQYELHDITSMRLLEATTYVLSQSELSNEPVRSSVLKTRGTLAVLKE
jgi:hypothetical protein